MSNFQAEIAELQRAQALLRLVETKLSNWSPIITRAYHRLGNQQNSTVTNVRGAIVGWGKIYDVQWEKIKNTITFLDTVMAEMEQAENLAYKEFASEDIKEDKKENVSKPSSGQQSTSTISKPQENVDINREMQERYKRLQSVRSTYDGRCGAFVYQQLKDQGILSGESIALGKDYYSYFANKNKTMTGYSVEAYGGRNGLINLLNANQGKTLRNIAVSFNRYGNIYPSDAGHVMLITQIKDGKVYYMDSGDTYPDGTKHTEGTPACQTIEQFLKRYPNMNGVVHFYK